MAKANVYLRICVTGRCNYKCFYCHAEGNEEGCMKDLPAQSILAAVRIAKDEGITKIKLTGGEPLVRKDTPQIIRSILEEYPSCDLSLTTNGFLLKQRAEELATAGLTRLNVSINSLDAANYKSITGIDGLPQVLEGICHAQSLGISIKINTMISKDNITEIMDFITYCSKERLALRFLDLLPVHSGTDKSIIPLDDLNIALKALSSSCDADIQHGTEVRKFVIKGAHVMTKVKSYGKKCATCQYRDQCGEGIYALRLNTDGKLQPCLFRKDYLLPFSTADETEKRENFKKAVSIALS